MDFGFKIEGEPEEVTQIRQKIIDAFRDLVFVEEGHQYFLNGQTIPSVTNVIKQFENESDWDEIATNYAKNHGETAQYWKDKWKFNNLRATTTGTLVHEFGESYGYYKNGLTDFITPSCRQKYDREHNWLIPTRPKEEAIIKVYEDLPDSFHFVLAETKVYSNKVPEFQTKQQYCGTFDLLMYYKHPNDDSRSGLVIMDWKTNGSLVNKFNRSKGLMMLDPFADMVDEALSAYTLQLSAYQIPLEDIGLKIIGRRLLWLKDDGTYEKISLPDKTKELRAVL